jgi:small subunit ribosomal protein S6
MRRYETFVIIDPDISREDRDALIERVKELITQMDGFLVFEDDWGERKLAYEIRKKERGYYVRFDYCGMAPLVGEIERFFRIDDRALKYMTVVLDKDADLEKVKEEKAAAESKRELEKAAAAASQEEDAAGSPAEDIPAGETAADSGGEAPASAAAESATEPTPSEKKEEA